MSIMETNYAILWIEIYPVDSTIQRLNNWGLVDSIIHLLNSWGQVYSSKCKQPYYLKYRLGTYIYPYEGLLYPGSEYGYGLGVSDSDCLITK